MVNIRSETQPSSPSQSSATNRCGSHLRFMVLSQ